LAGFASRETIFLAMELEVGGDHRLPSDVSNAGEYRSSL
jgi:hypothetical protein